LHEGAVYEVRLQESEGSQFASICISGTCFVRPLQFGAPESDPSRWATAGEVRERSLRCDRGKATGLPPRL
jgi:hypothetical protein